jgi:predicted nucleotidyltransferase
MDAKPFLVEVGRSLRQLHLDAVLIGNAAAALQGAPVTTVDFDFLFRSTAGNLRKLKALARALGATVLRPYYPASDLYRVVREDDGLQVDFMGTIHGIRSFEGVRARATVVEIDGVPILVASLADIVRSKKAAGRPRDRAVLEILERGSAYGLAERPPAKAKSSEIAPAGRFPRRPLQKPNGRKAKLAAVARESERGLRDLIHRWQALPPPRRTKFLRKRMGFGRTAL